MNIVIIDATDFRKTRFDQFIDHAEHRVVYVGDDSYLGKLPDHCIKFPRARVFQQIDALKACFPGEIDLVLTTNERTQLEAARLREVLAVKKGMRPSEQLLTLDKVLMKTAVQKAQLRTPRFQTLPGFMEQAAAEIAGLSKLVLKPRMGFCAIGIRIFDSAAELLDFARTLSAEEIEVYQVEEFIRGDIYHFDGLMWQGQLVSSMVFKYFGNCFDSTHLGMPVGSIESDIDEDHRVSRWATAVLTSLGVLNGAFHLEFFEDADGHLIFLECASRMGGALVCDTFQLRRGLHIPEVQYLIESGQDLAPALSPGTPDARHGFLIFQNDGRWEALAQLPAEIEGFRNLIGLHLSTQFNQSRGTFTEGAVPLTAMFQGSNVAELKETIHQFVQLIDGALGKNR